MAKSNRSTFARVRPHHHFVYDHELEIPLDIDPERDHDRPQRSHVNLDALMRSHRGELVATARRRLRVKRHAEDVVQQVCLDALEGRLALSDVRDEVLAELRMEVVARCSSRGA